MKRFNVMLFFISLISCNNDKDFKRLKEGKYYAAHGFHNEYIIIKSDSSYNHYVDGKVIKSARWKILPERSKVSFESFTEIVDWDTGLLRTDTLRGSRLFTYQTDGLLDAGLDPLNFIHESLWDKEYHVRK